jgi:uncharacterized membrane protein HdeD (DUF308 family)
MEEVMAQPTPMPMCPMAEMCKGMMERPFSGAMLIVPGLVFLALGVLIIFEPRILAWIIATAFVLLGIMMLMMAGFVRRIGTKFQTMHDQPS